MVFWFEVGSILEGLKNANDRFSDVIFKMPDSMYSVNNNALLALYHAGAVATVYIDIHWT